MALKQRVVVDNDTNEVINAILIEDGAEWENPENTYTIDNETAKIGDTFDTDTETFIPPTPAPSPAPPTNVNVNLLGALLVSKGLITQAELNTTKV